MWLYSTLMSSPIVCTQLGIQVNLLISLRLFDFGVLYDNCSTVIIIFLFYFTFFFCSNLLIIFLYSCFETILSTRRREATGFNCFELYVGWYGFWELYTPTMDTSGGKLCNIDSVGFVLCYNWPEEYDNNFSYRALGTSTNVIASIITRRAYLYFINSRIARARK